MLQGIGEIAGVLQESREDVSALQGGDCDGKADTAAVEAYFNKSFKNGSRLKAVGGEGQEVGNE